MSPRRRDVLVILARGESRRMGHPKGLLPSPDGSGRSFVGALAAAYRPVLDGGVVVTTTALAPAYAAAVAAWPWLRVVGGESGGETALSFALGQAAVGADATHLWLQPVDLPDVRTATLLALRTASVAAAGRVVRAWHRAGPGHPVIVPVGLVPALFGATDWRHRPVREVLAAAVGAGRIDPVVAFAVDDPGTVRDYDDPATLTSGPEPAEEPAP